MTENRATEGAQRETAGTGGFDYRYVPTTARVALYDDLKSAPRITKIEPAATIEYIEHLATCIYEQSKLAGGKIPYTVIREVSENFIHAQFREIVVSILDDGNTIRFADQGPGIAEKEKAQQPGFSSAIEPMKDYIRGVGSGFPIVREYLVDRQGSITIEDNLVSGAVVTISLVPPKKDSGMPAKTERKTHANPTDIPLPPLSEKERAALAAFAQDGVLGVSDLSKITGMALSTTHTVLVKLEEAGLVERTAGQKRMLSDIGSIVASKVC